MMTVSTDKAYIRKVIKNIRDSLDADDCRRWSMSICHSFLKLDVYRSAGYICAYISKKNEADTRPIIEQAWRDGKSVCVPKVYGDNMHFIQINRFDELLPGNFGIMEPRSDIYSDPETGLIVMPGVAFDKSRNRIGFGGGYYDRYLENHQGLTKAALAYSCQIVDRIDSEDTDIKPDLIVTESNIII